MVVGDVPLDRKIVVVTGGGSGINLAFVRQAFNAGAKVLVADLKLTTEAEELVRASQGSIAFATCDVSRWSDLTSLPSQVSQQFGAKAVADVWIAGAGVFEPAWSSFLEDAEDEHYKQLQINTEHPIKLTRIAMRSSLGADKPGVVLIVASGAGVTGAYGSPLYCASKHAVVGFTKSMAQADDDENFKIVCICPGMVSTPLWTGEQAKDKHQQFSYTDDVCITPEEVATAMMEMVQMGKYRGGSLMEVCKERMRNPLESHQAFVVTPETKAFADTCYAPIREVFNRERGVAGANGAKGVH
ncbi:hypothetical protein LTR53_007342 [Teratosphaeriaceae sp. CCFEE 6253]|nr:hypothetical protein LTR53_007342 [Teratosphaeriaceae sp. CCFEE 6253]